MPDHSATLLEVIVRLTRTVRAAFESRAKEQDLTYARARLLIAISKHEGASQAELAATLGIETPTLKRLLDALEAQGLAERHLARDDGRKYAVHLTDTARTEPLLGFCVGVDAKLTQGIAPEDLATTRRTLTRMAANAQDLKSA